MDNRINKQTKNGKFAHTFNLFLSETSSFVEYNRLTLAEQHSTKPASAVLRCSVLWYAKSAGAAVTGCTLQDNALHASCDSSCCAGLGRTA